MRDQFIDASELSMVKQHFYGNTGVQTCALEVCPIGGVSKIETPDWNEMATPTDENVAQFEKETPAYTASGPVVV